MEDPRSTQATSLKSPRPSSQTPSFLHFAGKKRKKESRASYSETDFSSATACLHNLLSSTRNEVPRSGDPLKFSPQFVVSFTLIDTFCQLATRGGFFLSYTLTVIPFSYIFSFFYFRAEFLWAPFCYSSVVCSACILGRSLLSPGALPRRKSIV